MSRKRAVTLDQMFESFERTLGPAGRRDGEARAKAKGLSLREYFKQHVIPGAMLYADIRTKYPHESEEQQKARFSNAFEDVVHGAVRTLQ